MRIKKLLLKQPLSQPVRAKTRPKKKLEAEPEPESEPEEETEPEPEEEEENEENEENDNDDDNDDNDNDDNDNDDEEENDTFDNDNDDDNDNDNDNDDDNNGNDNDNDDDDEENGEKALKKQKSFLRKDAQQYTEQLEKRGVIYLSRVPPLMKPNQVRYLLEQYGTVTRLFLAEEDPQHRRMRKQRGGNASKQFTEGWVEFADKKVAKNVAFSLNGKSIGAKKRDYYHDDIWNLKYLSKFKWEFLTEKLAYERRVRENKLRAAMIQAKKENAEFTDLVEKNRVQKIIEERKAKRSGGAKQDTGDDSGNARKRQREFPQNKPLPSSGVSGVDKSVLKTIWGNA